MNRDLTGVFQGPVSVTKRVPPKQVPEQIYNGGVLYGEGHAGIAFWGHFVEVYQHLPRDSWHWYGDQIILSHLVPDYPGTNVYPDTHNYIWSHSSELNEVLPYYIVHFKGPKRKGHMPRYLETLKAHYGSAQDIRRSA